MNSTPAGNRIHIGIFGRRNSGKSSLINALTGQSLAIVSDTPGTTTDPVIKPMELLPLGPVVFIDTAGIDDEGDLGRLRVEKTYETMRKTEIALLVISAGQGISDYEKDIAGALLEKKVPVIGIINKSDLNDINDDELLRFSEKTGVRFRKASALRGTGIEELKEEIARKIKSDDTRFSIVGDLINPGDIVVLVTPVDNAAPKGRLILPQQQTIRDIIDSDCAAVITKEHELKTTLESLKRKPALVITDSQAFLKVSADTPTDIPMTSFSILFARAKGDLAEMAKGIKKMESLKPGSRVLIMEACTHHQQSDDIGTVKIPRWLRQIAGGDIEFIWMRGNKIPDDLEKFDLIIHCGACMLNRPEMQHRINLAREKGVAITNYGMFIAYVHGILDRALEPFPAASMAYNE